MEIINKIEITDIYDKNINFLIGAGASSGLFSTLSLAMEQWKYTFETLLDEVNQETDDTIKRKLRCLVFMSYYKMLISPVQECSYSDYQSGTSQYEVIKNYELFIESILHILLRQDNKECNIFTTNYDGCLPYISDNIIQKGNIDFAINDGTSGFFKKQLEARNYNRTHHRTGMFSEYKEHLPTVKIIPLHGSAYWSLENGKIFVDYKLSKHKAIIPLDIESFCDLLKQTSTNYGDIYDYAHNSNQQSDWLTEKVINDFWNSYRKIPIVNPTKEKFNETVLKEHFYQMLRLMSYELEKRQTVMITFGFSFADEHILSLIKRSLSNPSLQLYICCYSDDTVQTMTDIFKNYRNVKLVRAKGSDDNTCFLNFSEFNKNIFNLDDLLELDSSNGVT